MAQTSSVQREPSMEEILASIRRIIEDSDTVRKGPDEMPGRAAADSGRLDSAVIEVDAFRAELRAARIMPEVEPMPTLADVQARIAAEEEAISHGAASDYEAELPVLEDHYAETAVPAAPEWSLVAEPTEAAAPEPEMRHDEGPQAAWDELPVEQPAADEARGFEAPRFETVSAAPADVARSIISEHTGRQVAAAFGELSEAFAARSRKTFDEMAEQMLRPMLQDWLDNNLPTLVERLVREEIERVARGG
jgi:hypothetical protein